MNKKKALQEISNWYNVELLPCPFCGLNDDAKPMVTYVEHRHDSDVHWTVQCTNCGCEPESCIYSPQEAISFWNTRALMPKTEDALIGFELARKELVRLVRNMDVPFTITPNKIPEVPSILFTPIDDMELTVRTHHRLYNEGFFYLGDIVCHDNLTIDKYKPFGRLLSMINFGRKSYQELLEELDKLGFQDYYPCPEYWDKRNDMEPSFLVKSFPFKNALIY